MHPPVTGTIAGQVASRRGHFPTYAVYRDGLKRPAMPAMRHALLHPVAPVSPDPLDAAFAAPTAHVTS